MNGKRLMSVLLPITVGAAALLTSSPLVVSYAVPVMLALNLAFKEPRQAGLNKDLTPKETATCNRKPQIFMPRVLPTTNMFCQGANPVQVPSTHMSAVDQKCPSLVSDGKPPSLFDVNPPKYGVEPTPQNQVARTSEGVVALFPRSRPDVPPSLLAA